MLTPLLALWTVVIAQAPDSATRTRYAAALHSFADSLNAVQAAAVAFQADLSMASSDLVLARARRMRERCGAARRAAQALAELLAVGGYSARTRPAEVRARRDLARLERVLLKCERDYDTGSATANADTLKAWAPFRLTQLEADLRRHVQGVQDFQGQAGIR